MSVFLIVKCWVVRQACVFLAFGMLIAGSLGCSSGTAGLEGKFGAEVGGEERNLRARVERRAGSARAHRELAQFLLARGDTQEAQSEAEVAWRLQPLQGKNLIILGQALLANGYSIQALQILEQAVVVSPRDWQTGLLLGSVLAEQGKWQQAENILQQTEINSGRRSALDEALAEILLDSGQLYLASARLNGLSESPVVRVLMARLEHLYGRSQQALKILDDGLKKYPHSQCLIEERIDFLWRLARWQELSQALQSSFASDVSLTNSHIYRALLTQSKGQPKSAQALLQARQQKYPKDVKTRLVLAQMQLQAYQPQQVLETLQQVLNLSSAHAVTPWVRRMRASVYLSLSRSDLAQVEIEQAERIQSNHRHTHLLRIAVLIQQSRQEEAQRLLNKYLEHSPHDTQALLLKVDIATLAQDFQQALDIINSIGPLAAPQHVAFARARQAYLTQRYSKALSIVSQISAQDTEFGISPWRVQILKAISLNALKKTRAAQNTLRPWLSSPATNGWAARLAGDMLHLNGQVKEAQRIYNRALNTFPNSPLLLEGLSRTAIAQGQKQRARIALEKGLAQVSPWQLIFIERLRILKQPNSLQNLLQQSMPSQLLLIPSPPPGPLFLPPQLPVISPRFFYFLQQNCSS